MSSIAQKRSFFPIPIIATSTNRSLPVSYTAESKAHEETGTGTGTELIRRRLSSMSLLKIQSNPSAADAASSSYYSSWSFPRSKSLSSMGDYAGTSIRKWWDWGWTWILSRKPMFARDLEMNEQETKILGSHDRGTWRHVFYKLRSEIRRLITSDQVALPQTYRQFHDPTTTWRTSQARKLHK